MQVSTAINSADSQRRRSIWAATVGNAFEWFDFIAFGLFTVPISRTFFPEQSSVTPTLLAVGVGFVMRPIGAIVMGAYADRAGRQAAMTIVILLMTLGTALIVVTPGVATIGPMAAALLIVGRLLQGFSIGGELGGSTSFLMEWAPPGRRTLYASFQLMGQFGATLIGVVAGAVVSSLLSPAEILSWGWRIPFALGLLIGPIGVYIRARAADPSEFAQAKPASRPLRDIAGGHRLSLLISFGLTILATVFTYVLIIYMPTFAVRELGLKLSDTFVALVVSSLAGLAASPLAGYLGDRIGRRPVALVAAFLILVLVYPLMAWLTASPSALVLACIEAFLSILLAFFACPGLAMAADVFPANVRSTGLSIGYNLSVVLFGGFSPYIVNWLISATGSRMAPAYYVAAAAALTLLTLLLHYKKAPAEA